MLHVNKRISAQQDGKTLTVACLNIKTWNNQLNVKNLESNKLNGGGDDDDDDHDFDVNIKSNQIQLHVSEIHTHKNKYSYIDLYR